MAGDLFDLSDEYEAMLRMGVDLSGQDLAQFIPGQFWRY
jgi:hypothetical protein